MYVTPLNCIYIKKINVVAFSLLLIICAVINRRSRNTRYVIIILFL
jgi:hypothetical protein